MAYSIRWLTIPALIVFLPAAGWAWGEEGHIIVARIAEAHLTPEAKAAVKDLLGDQAITDPRVNCWPDHIRRSAVYGRRYPKNDMWHYINIELKVAKADFKPAEDNDHVIGAVERFAKVLREAEATKDDRKHALMFIVHFIGDLHQPLHCANRDDDKGGNQQPIKSFLGVKEDKLNLHKVWDTNMVLAVRGDLTNEDFAKRLLDEMDDAVREKWSKGDVREWVWECHTVAAASFYRFNDDKPLPPRDAPAAELTEENYVKFHRPIVRDQLKKGGIRLARTLNDCFAVKKPAEPR